MRNIGKGRQLKFVKMIRKYLNEAGALPTTEWFTGEAYKLETKAGALYLHLEEPSNDSSLFSIFGRFLDVEKAKLVIINRDCRLNSYSGKFNFHYKDEDDCFEMLQYGLEPILEKRPVTAWYRLKTDMSYESGCKLHFDNKIYHGERAGVDNGNVWNMPKNTKTIVINGVACFIKKSTPFQFWTGNVM